LMFRSQNDAGQNFCSLHLPTLASRNVCFTTESDLCATFRDVR